MKSSWSILLLALFVFTPIRTFPTALAEPTFSPPSDDKLSTRYIVKYKNGSLDYKMRLQIAAREALNGEALDSVSSIQDLKLLDYGKFLPKANAEIMYFNSEEAIKTYEDKEDVEYVELDHKVYLMAEQVPYGINNVKALRVSDVDVSNRKVCVIDTGYDMTHPDLTSDSTIVTGYSGGYSEGPTPWSYDGNGHGTHVAGTIAAIGGNGEGVAGVNRNGELKLHIVKLFDDYGDWAWGSNLIAAVEICVDEGANIINMSLGGAGFSQTEYDTYERIFKENDVLSVAAAGNRGNTSHSYPASYDYVMSVAATDINNRIATFSQNNDQVDIAAPGVNILSTLPSNVASYGYGTMSGTSMATPHVSGVAALVWSRDTTKSAAEIRQALEGSTQDLGEPGRDNFYGHGLVRADLATAFLDSGFTLEPTSAPKLDACTDDPIGWYDSDGEGFNCEWYAVDNYCEQFGNGFENFGTTANKACCACGGGIKNTISPTESVSTNTQSPAPSAISSVSPSTTFSTSPSNTPTNIPSTTLSDSPSSSFSANPTDEPDPCTDNPNGWYDSDGEDYSCKWYATRDYCQKYGNAYRNFGMTANEACCACGGGITKSQVPSGTSKDPSASPSVSSSLRPSEHPSDSPSVRLSASPTLMPSMNPSLWPSTGPTISLSARPSHSPSASFSSFPSENPSDSPSVRPSALPTMTPSMRISTSPSTRPTITITTTAIPSSSPSVSFSSRPSEHPSDSPSVGLSALPTWMLSTKPSSLPSTGPTIPLSARPSHSPSASFSSFPSDNPSNSPSVRLSASPTLTPSMNPSSLPSTRPTITITTSAIPSSSPSASFSSKPSGHPSNASSASPTALPTLIPTLSLSTSPSTGPTVMMSEKPSHSPSASWPSEQPSFIPSSNILSSHSPTKNPSSSPIRSLFTPLDCPAGETALHILVKTDGKGRSDNSFRVSEKGVNGKFKIRKWIERTFTDNATNAFGKCLPSNACYKFFMIDESRDGMCCDFGEGGYIVSWNESILKDTLTDLSFKSDKRSKSPKFGDGC